MSGYCNWCGEIGCDGECDPDYEAPCEWCGEPGCPGYCNEDDYNVREEVTGEDPWPAE